MTQSLFDKPEGESDQSGPEQSDSDPGDSGETNAGEPAESEGDGSESGLDLSVVPSGVAAKSKREAFAQIHADGTASNQRAKLALLYYRVWRDGIELAGERIRALTDFEAAHITGIRKASVRARRNALCGDGTRRAYEKEPIVQEAGRRKSLVEESGQEVTTYQWRPELFGEHRIDEILKKEGVPDAVANYDGGPAYTELSPSQRAAIEAAAAKAGRKEAKALAKAFRTGVGEVLGDF